MTNLRILQPAGRRLVTLELARDASQPGAIERWPESAWLPLVVDPPRGIDLGALDAVIAELVQRFERFDAAMDAWLAPRLHRALPMSRREAAEPGVWRYLSVVHGPELVRHRWENVSWPLTRARFWSTGTRHTSNPYARLWWIAEMTREAHDYALTERALARQSLAIQLFVRAWSAHRPAVAACVDGLGDAPGEVVERVARELSRHLGTVTLEALDGHELRDLVARMKRGSAVGLTTGRSSS